MKQLTPEQLVPPRTSRPFEILPEHRQRTGWQWLWDRLLQPLPAKVDGVTERDAEEAVAS